MWQKARSLFQPPFPPSLPIPQEAVSPQASPALWRVLWEHSHLPGVWVHGERLLVWLPQEPAGQFFKGNPAGDVPRCVRRNGLSGTKLCHPQRSGMLVPDRFFLCSSWAFPPCFLPSLISAFTLLLPIHWQGIPYRPVLQKQCQYCRGKKASLGALLNLFPLIVSEREEMRA